MFFSSLLDEISSTGLGKNLRVASIMLDPAPGQIYLSRPGELQIVA
jgi:hypothetical protein